MTPLKPKVILIGLDGAPFPQINKWISLGKLPNLAEMSSQGIFTKLHSTTHPISPIAWNTIVTGQNAGKHGVYDFGKRRLGSYQFDLVNSSTRKSPALWDFLAQTGHKSGIFNVPVTFPPLNLPGGYMVSGLLTPNRDSLFASPSELTKKILEWSPNYRVPGEDAIFVRGREIDFIQQLIHSVENQERVILNLIDEFHDLDFHMFVFMQSDHLHHKLWNHIEMDQPNNPIYIEILKLYSRLDEAIGKIKNKFKNDTASFIVVSDHGGGSLDKIVSLNQWLIQKGWMTLKKDPTRSFKRIIKKLRLFPKLYKLVGLLGLGRIAKMLPTKWQAAIATSFTSFDDVEWSKTKAYAYGKYGQIYLNLHGREPQGCVRLGTESEQILKSISDELLQLTDPESGQTVVKKVYRRDELYNGPHAFESPDLIFSMADYRFDSSTDLGFLDTTIFRNPEFNDTGTHRLDGILIASGAGIANSNNIENARVEDIAPSVLGLLKQTIPSIMDGQSLFNSDHSSSHLNHDFSFKNDLLSPPELTQKEKDEIENRLRSLGYLG